MPFVTTGEMLKKAQAGGYAIGAFNAENLEMARKWHRRLSLLRKPRKLL